MKASERAFWVVLGLLPLVWVLCLWVIIARSIPATPPPVRSIPPPDYPPANWDRLCVGMPQVEVASLLGPPSRRIPVRQVRGSPTTELDPLLEAIVVFIARIWLFGIDGLCDTECDRWEYDGGPSVTPRRFFQFGSFEQAFVVYFVDKKVVWMRRPTAGPLVDGE